MTIDTYDFSVFKVWFRLCLALALDIANAFSQLFQKLN